MREALASKLIRETQQDNIEKKDENESRMRRLELERKVAKQKKTQMDIISDMTRQFKSVEEDLTNKINSLEKRKSDYAEEIR